MKLLLRFSGTFSYFMKNESAYSAMLFVPVFNKLGLFSWK